MDILARGDLLSAAVTILALVLFFLIMMRVGQERGRHKIEAPAVTGHPVFERAYRVQMNTVEQALLFLPALWLATIYFKPVAWLPALLGLVWVVGRFLYMHGYIADPKKRSTGFLISFLATILLILLAIAGVVMAWMAM